MKYLQNLHQHCTFCDGKNTPEEVVLGAIEQGFDSIGFSSHSYSPWATAFCPKMTVDATEYKNAIRNLKEAYKGKLDIYCGLEVDFMSPCSLEGYDYLIGTVHNLEKEGAPIAFDRGVDVVWSIIHDHFAGDGMAFAKEYYRTLQRLPEKGNFDILGHIDIHTKHIEKHAFFDTRSKEYRNAGMEAIEHLAGKIPYFEMNTGAIGRGYRTVPYPMDFFLPELKRLGYGVVITSDCHNIQHLSTGFDLAEEMLKEAGFREHYILKDGKFIPVEF